MLQKNAITQKIRFGLLSPVQTLLWGYDRLIFSFTFRRVKVEDYKRDHIRDDYERIGGMTYVI